MLQWEQRRVPSGANQLVQEGGGSRSVLAPNTVSFPPFLSFAAVLGVVGACFTRLVWIANTGVKSAPQVRASFWAGTPPPSARNGSGVIKECCFGVVVTLSEGNGWIFRPGGFLDLLGGWDKDSGGQKWKFLGSQTVRNFFFTGFLRKPKSCSGIARRPPLCERENRGKWDG